MTKDEFLNLVYVAYNSAIKVKKESKQKLDYFSQLNIDNEERKKLQRLYDVANINIKRLKEILSLPLYEKIKQLTNQELREYRQHLIDDQNATLKEKKDLLDGYIVEHEKLINDQNQNYISFSSETDDDKKKHFLEEGNSIQLKITRIEEDIVNHKNLIEQIQKNIRELQTKSLEDIQEELISNMGLQKFKEKEEIKNIFSDDVVKVANNSGDVVTLLELLQKYKNINNEIYGYEIILPSNEVAKQLSYLNKDKKMIENNILKVESFADMYSLESVLKTKKEHIDWRVKTINREYRPIFKDFQFILETLLGINDLDIETFKNKINLIIEKNQKLSYRVTPLLSTLTELNTFIGRNFKAKQISETKKLIVDEIYKFIISQLEETLRILNNCVKDINYDNNVDFNSEILMSYLKKLTSENCLEVVVLVNENIDDIYKVFEQIARDLVFIKEDVDKKNPDLKLQLNKKFKQLDFLNCEINLIVGTKLQSSDLEKLLQIYSSENLAENLANVEFLQLLNQVHSQAYLQKVNMDELYSFNNNLIENNFEEEETKRV